MRITASVYINDAEDGLLHDYDVWLEKLAPHDGRRRKRVLVKIIGEESLRIEMTSST